MLARTSAAACLVLSFVSSAFACTPGPFLCWPSEQVVRDHLAETHKDITIETIRFSVSPFAKPSHTSQHFRVEFEGEGALTGDIFRELRSDELGKACEVPEDFSGLYDLRLFRRLAREGDKVKYSGDTALSGVNGQWYGTADLMKFADKNGEKIIGNTKDVFGEDIAIVGEPSGVAACAKLLGK